jgi:3-phenylpropionate/trans-cinnamate dioxygenase ferredoxin subunit
MAGEATGKWTDVGPANLLPGESESVRTDTVALALFNVNGTYYALEDVCTHDGGELSGGPFEETTVTCPRHGAQFDVRTGAVLCMPAVTPIPAFPVRIENGRVLVDLGSA